MSFPLSFDEVATIVYNRDNEKLKEMIEEKRIIDINMFGEDPWKSLLRVACESGDIKCVELLLNNSSININQERLEHLTLLSACHSGNVDILKLMLARGLEINDALILKCFEKETYGYKPHIDFLFEYIKDSNYHNDRHVGFLRGVCKAGNVNLATKLLQKGADRNEISFYYLLLAACGEGDIEIVKLLLTWNTPVRLSSEDLEQALKKAAYKGYIDIVRSIVEYGIDCTALACVLSLFAEKNYVDIVEYLLDKGALVSFTAEARMRNILTSACEHGYVDLVKLFLSRGADPNLTDGRGETPLEAVLESPHIVKALLDAGADPNPLLADGDTMLVRIARPRNRHQYTLEVLTLLLGFGADPNLAHTETGESAIMLAAVARRVDQVKLLLEYGADVTQVNSEGKSVMDMLERSRKNGEVIELCTSYIESNKQRKPILK